MLDDFIKMIIEGYSNSLLVVSPAGLGKTYSVTEILEQLGLEKGKHYLYLSNYITPVEMFLLLEKVNSLDEPKLLVLDDVEAILPDKKVVGMLRGALWQTNGRRVVNYLSGTYRITNQSIEDFQGRIIFLVNEIGDNSMLKALKDRGLYYSFDLTNKEVLDIIKSQILPKEYKNLGLDERTKVYRYLGKMANSDIKLTLRDFIKAMDCYLYSSDRWQLLVNKILNKN